MQEGQPCAKGFVQKGKVSKYDVYPNVRDMSESKTVAVGGSSLLPLSLIPLIFHLSHLN